MMGYLFVGLICLGVGLLFGLKIGCEVGESRRLPDDVIEIIEYVPILPRLDRESKRRIRQRDRSRGLPAGLPRAAKHKTRTKM